MIPYLDHLCYPKAVLGNVTLAELARRTIRLRIFSFVRQIVRHFVMRLDAERDWIGTSFGF